MITWDEIIEETNTAPTNSTSEKAGPANFYILLVFLLITIALLIAVNIYFCIIKEKQK